MKHGLRSPWQPPLAPRNPGPRREFVSKLRHRCCCRRHAAFRRERQGKGLLKRSDNGENQRVCRHLGRYLGQTCRCSLFQRIERRRPSECLGGARRACSGMKDATHYWSEVIASWSRPTLADPGVIGTLRYNGEAHGSCAEQKYLLPRQRYRAGRRKRALGSSA